MAVITGQAMGQTRARYTEDYETGRLIVSLVAPEIVRVQMIPKGANADFARVPIVLPQPAIKDQFTVQTAETYTDLTASRLRVRVHHDAPRVDLYTADGRPLSLDADGIADHEGSLRDTRAFAPDEEFFGGGLQFHSMAQRGRTKTLRVNADPSTDLGNSHAVVPFFLSTAGYGIFLDSHAKTEFDLGKAAPDRLSFQTPDPVIDYYLCLGPTFHELLARYTQLTGRMPMPPKWGLGFWYRMKSEWKQDKVEEVARAFREHDIPCDVIGLEPAWQTHAYSCSYVWNHAQFPDPQAFVAALRAEHLHVNLWEHAYVHPTSPIHDALQRANAVGDQPVWGGLVPDFTRPEARTLFADLHTKEHISLGVDGYKLDECDGSDFTGGWFFPDDTRFPSGMTGAQMHNVFGLLYQKTFHEFFDRLNRRSYFLCRGMFAGAQGYSSVIYSDWYGFREYVRAAANSGFSGVLWCPEVRQTDDPKEFVRRFQTVFFSPLAMINAWADGVTPWEKGPEVERIFRRYADLRMQLTPYLYSAFWRMHRTGLPVVRALVMDTPNDRQTYTVDDEFLYGDSLLVAPILQGETRHVYLPHGPWIDWWTGTVYAGEQTIECSASLDQLPLFVRAGAIVPMQPRMRYADEIPVETLTLRVFPGQESAGEPFTLYEDDAETLNYRQGAGVQTVLRCTATPESVLLQASAPKGAYTPAWKRFAWEVEGIDRPPKRVLLGGRALPQLTDDTAIAAGYRYDAIKHVLHIVTPYGKAQSIRITR
jgi:alpha-D-xyloside xylohydrolase